MSRLWAFVKLKFSLAAALLLALLIADSTLAGYDVLINSAGVPISYSLGFLAGVFLRNALLLYVLYVVFSERVVIHARVLFGLD